MASLDPLLRGVSVRERNTTGSRARPRRAQQVRSLGRQRVLSPIENALGVVDIPLPAFRPRRLGKGQFPLQEHRLVCDPKYDRRQIGRQRPTQPSRDFRGRAGNKVFNSRRTNCQSVLPFGNRTGYFFAALKRGRGPSHLSCTRGTLVERIAAQGTRQFLGRDLPTDDRDPKTGMFPLERALCQRVEHALDQHGTVAEIDNPFQSQQAVLDPPEGRLEFASVRAAPRIEQVASSSGGAMVGGAWQGTCCRLWTNSQPTRP